MFVFFFFQAEDGIRDTSVTGVQTCALPICSICDNGSAAVFSCVERVTPGARGSTRNNPTPSAASAGMITRDEIGRASCRERVKSAEGAGEREKKRGGGGGSREQWIQSTD